MKMRNLCRLGGVIAATFAFALVAAGTADAAPQKISKAAYKSAKVNKKTQRVYGYTAGTRRAKTKTVVWHGWVVRSPAVFYWEGQRFDGGTPKGPAMWYNNGEGGFNAAAFWKISDRYSR